MSQVFEQLGDCPVIPVIVIEDLAQAVPLAEALLEGGLLALEVTLRTPDALAAIEAIATALPDAQVGAGTVIAPDQFQAVIDAGGRFAVSPCLTETLASAATQCQLPWLPGVVTASEVQVAREKGFTDLKFFPAGTSGGPSHLKGLSSVFQDVRFCPTGGVSESNMADYFAVPSVTAVGGSWLMPPAAVASGDWRAVTATARQACSAALSARQ